MKLEKRKNLVLVVVILMIMALCTVSYASTVTYHSNGSPSMIETSKGTIYYYENGNVDYITTSTGSIYYNEDGSIDFVTGTVSITLEEAKAELQKLEKKEPTTSTSKNETEKMPSTGVEDYLFVPIVLFMVLAVIFGIKYNSIRKV